jgi:hypothetical protein
MIFVSMGMSLILLQFLNGYSTTSAYLLWSILGGTINFDMSNFYMVVLTMGT